MYAFMYVCLSVCMYVGMYDCMYTYKGLHHHNYPVGVEQYQEHGTIHNIGNYRGPYRAFWDSGSCKSRCSSWQVLNTIQSPIRSPALI